MTMRLAQLSTRGFPGLPDVDVELQPVTALIGPRASGKSRLLAAVSWLLSGRVTLGAEAGGALVRAQLQTPAGTREIVRRDGEIAPVDVPQPMFLAARDRLPALPEALGDGASGAARAEAMVAHVAEMCRSGNSGIVLLVEEPEIMLTPLQQRHLYHLLRDFAEHNQVIYSTRSPALLDAVHHHEIVRLDLTSTGYAVRRAPVETLSDDERLRLEAEVDHERAEMFFATAVVLVEGQTERQALPLIFRRLGYDPDALGIAVVEVGGKGNLTLVARVLAELRIPHLIVHDSDRGRPAAAENEVIRRSAGNAPIIELDPDFEAAAGIHSHDDKVLHAWRRFAAIAPERIPRVFRRLVATAVALAGPGAPAGRSTDT